MSETIEDRLRPSFVCIIKHHTETEPEKIIEERGPHPRWKAEKIDDGLNINLNHEYFYTLIFSREELDLWKARHVAR